MRREYNSKQTINAVMIVILWCGLCCLPEMTISVALLDASFDKILLCLLSGLFIAF